MSFFSKLFNNKTNEDEFDSIISKAVSTANRSNIQPQSKAELEKIIKETIEKNGPNCNLNFIDVSQITDMSHLFEESDFNGDIRKWNVSNVTTMEKMFRKNKKFEGDLSNWNVSNVTNMEGCFSQTIFNGDISKWNVSKVTNMRSMFYEAKFNGDISKWNVSEVTNMRSMFYCADFNSDISKWNVSKVTNMDHMFSGPLISFFGRCNFNGDISNWDVSNVTNMNSMFKKSQFHGDIRKWNLTKKWKSGTDITDMFVYTKFTSEEINALFE